MDDPNDAHRRLRRRVLRGATLIGTAMALQAIAAEPAPSTAVEAHPNAKSLDQSRGSSMPLARIDISQTASSELIRIVSTAIYQAMVNIAKVPVHDKFQIIHRHAADEIIYPQEGYLGLRYTHDLILIQITWVRGRSTQVKQQFFQAIATEIHEKGGIRKEDVWINLIDTEREDWSFGNGEMQYAPT
jgi:4-oxalocrotonate tautomerase